MRVKGQRKKTRFSLGLWKIIAALVTLWILLLVLSAPFVSKSITSTGGSARVPPNRPVLSVKASQDGAQIFPAPVEAAGPNATIILKPTFGVHRPDQDAVFVFAEGYDLTVFALFVTSLRENAGFDGDIVMSVSSRAKLKSGVETFLKQQNVVTYCLGVHDKGNVIDNMYGDSDSKALPDPRPSRPVATARFELYWVWSLHYRPLSRIMLVDARDVYFQRSPFDALPRTPEGSGGVIHFFEESTKETSAAKNIESSPYNKGWIGTAYGAEALKKISKRPVICSGGSIGDQVAMETYLRGMVKQWDDTRCKMKGCDQGYHNYLYYSGLLENAGGIGDIFVHKHGEGVFNNLGALRNSPFRTQGLLQNGTDLVLNWDGSVAPVAHQFDRDKELGEIMRNRASQIVSELKG
eukprot:CAMPEP_0113538764 /NCGR_PEP_ID=MMETSP0015_2-20120614/7547_1 /TAXON_ID=2838 /ORGANISM="Odontella" /LENGTH=407 /DNA_ID=CAMNT_0000438375 /DNA_START=225 /DNA_END=1448 /DNA_ORIENTATION=+ /assembly_acc=CAM_ASM_000160